MLKIFISCGGGMSSSALVQKLQKELAIRNLEHKYMFDFSPFSLAARDYSDYDLIMVCPHQRFNIEDYNNRFIKNRIPIYVLPTRIYGTMKLETIISDAKDVIDLFRQHPVNPVYFPGEENPLRVLRTDAFDLKGYRMKMQKGQD